MRNERLDSAFGRTPEAFSDRISHTLRHLEEEKPMKRLTLRTVAATILIIALLGGIACAVVFREWNGTTTTGLQLISSMSLRNTKQL